MLEDAVGREQPVVVEAPQRGLEGVSEDEGEFREHDVEGVAGEIPAMVVRSDFGV